MIKIILSAVLAAFTQVAAADNYPSRAITLIVPFAAGQAADVAARIVAAKLSEGIKQPVIVDNRPGAGGNIALGLAGHSPADGYTVFVGSSATHGINPAIYPKSSVDPIADFIPVAYTGWIPIVLSVSTNFPYQSVRELLASSAARAQKFQVAVANPGAQLTPQLFNNLAGTQYVPVPYKANGIAYGDVVGNRVPMIIDSAAGSLPMARAGKIRPLAVTSPVRSPVFPDVPTLMESGLAGFDLSPWNVYFLPKEAPPEVVRKLNAEIVKALSYSDTQAALRRTGYEPAPPMGVDEVWRFVMGEYKKWGDLARESGLKVE